MALPSSLIPHRFTGIVFPLVWLVFMFAGREDLIAFSLATGLLVCIFLYRIRSVSAVNLPLNNLSFIISAYFVWIFMTLAWTPFVSLSSICAWLLAFMPLTFWCATLLLEEEQDWQVLYIAMLGVMMIFAIWALIQYGLLHSVPQTSLSDKNLLATLLGAILLPSCAYYLLLREQPDKSIFQRRLLLIVIFILMLAFSIIFARVASVAFWGLFLFALLLLYKRLRFTTLWPLLLVLIISFGIGKIPVPGGMDYPLVPFEDSGMGRAILWKAAWTLITQHPWLGYGLGSFPLIYAPIRATTDLTAGYFVHNDFLQIWLEGGLPAIILLLAAPIIAIYSGFKLLLRNPHNKLAYEVVFLLAGIGLLYSNALFSFDLYYEPGLILLGLLLARLHYLLIRNVGLRSTSLSITQWIRPWLWKFGIIIIGLWALFYFVGVGLSYFLAKRAIVALIQHDYHSAMHKAQIIQILRPNYEPAYTIPAEIYSQSSANKKLTVAQRKILYQLALDKLKNAAATNPWDPLIPSMQAQLVKLNADWLDSDKTQISKLLLQALKLDPRYYPARIALAKYFLDEKQVVNAAIILVQGIQYGYPPSIDLLEYYKFTATVLRQLGHNEKNVAIVEGLITQTQQMLKQSKPSASSLPALNAAVSHSTVSPAQKVDEPRPE